MLNDPAARTLGCLIYGMPILEADKAADLIVYKRSMVTGCAILNNILFYMDKRMKVCDDTKKVVEDIVTAIE